MYLFIYLCVFIYLYNEGGQILEQVAQGGCVTFLVDTQSLIRCGPEQSSLTGPALSSGWSQVASQGPLQPT